MGWIIAFLEDMPKWLIVVIILISVLIYSIGFWMTILILFALIGGFYVYRRFNKQEN